MFAQIPFLVVVVFAASLLVCWLVSWVPRTAKALLYLK